MTRWCEGVERDDTCAGAMQGSLLPPDTTPSAELYSTTQTDKVCDVVVLILETLQALSVLSRSDVMNVFVTYILMWRCSDSLFTVWCWWCDSLTVWCWWCDSVTVWQCDVGVWQCDSLTVWCRWCDSLTVWCWWCDSVTVSSSGATMFTHSAGRDGRAPCALLSSVSVVPWLAAVKDVRVHTVTHHHTTHTHHHAGGHHRPRLHQGGQGGHCQSYHLHLCEQDPAVQGDNKQDRRGRECYLCNYGVVTSPQLGHTVTCDRLCLVPQSGDHSHSALWCVWVSRWDGLT